MDALTQGAALGADDEGPLRNAALVDDDLLTATQRGVPRHIDEHVQIGTIASAGRDAGRSRVRSPDFPPRRRPGAGARHEAAAKIT